MVYLLYCVFDHGGDEARYVGRAELQAWIRVHFDQPRLQVLVEHEIVAKDFEGELSTLGVDFSTAGLASVLN